MQTIKSKQNNVHLYTVVFGSSMELTWGLGHLILFFMMF